MRSFRPAEPGQAAAFLAWLRDQLGNGIVEEWTGVIPAGLDTVLLHHLPPPVTSTVDPRVARWRRAIRPGLCYYRVGPGFLEVRDLRVPADAVRMTIIDGELASVFGRCLTPVAAADLHGEDAACAERLLRERLLLRIDDHLLVAPYRMRRWPVPAKLALLQFLPSSIKQRHAVSRPQRIGQQCDQRLELHVGRR